MGHKRWVRSCATGENGDGTTTYLNTKLIWEKKSGDLALHDVDNLYTWSGDGETIPTP
jgi:hypothetical protein